MFLEFLLGSVLATIFVVNLLYIYMIWGLWEVECGSRKTSRRVRGNPSNRRPPNVKKWEDNKQEILDEAAKHPVNFGSCELLCLLAESQPKSVNKEAERRRSERLQRIDTFSPKDACTMGHSLSISDAKELDMDHVYLSFPRFLWAYYFIAPNSFFLWAKGIAVLLVRQALHRRGWIHPMEPFDPAVVVGKLLLEGTLAINFYARTTDGNIAGFFFPNFPILTNDGEYDVHDLFAVDIDLETKKFVKAKLDDEALTPSETLTLLWFYTISANHVKLHALANWGVNVEDKAHPFIQRNSLVTVMYNYFGYKTFPRLTNIWHTLGVITHKMDGLTEVFDHGVKANIWAHPKIHELMKHSSLVEFIVKTRAIFISEFEKYKTDFAGIHGEALFVGSILHSLDHTLMDRNLLDPLWLDVTCPKYGCMAELGRIVKVGFVSDVPGLLFHKRYKGAKHPFYASVYEKAAKFNADFASNMDTCIIK